MRKGVAALMMAVILAAAILPVYRGRAEAQLYRTISWGASGGDVSEAQVILRDWGYYSGPIDAVFGAQMSAAVKRFQRLNGLLVDGVIGSDTWAALGITVGGAAAAPPPTAGPAGRGVNVDLLARVVRAEAEGEPFEGKVGVAAVLLNRVQDARFPKSLEGVIYEPDAFESVSNGRIYNTPPTSNDVQAARDALNGWDPTYGAVFFWNPSKPVSAWIWTRTVITQIGNHIFAR